MTRLIALMLTSIIYCATLWGADWKSNVEMNIHNGNFAKANSIMNTLPSKEKNNRAEEIDSLRTIMQRIRNDFRISKANGIKQLKATMPNVTIEQIEDWKSKKYIETMNIDGKEFWFRKAIRNLRLLNKDLITTSRQAESDKEADKRLRYKHEAFSSCIPDKNGSCNWNSVQIKFTIDVKPNVVPAGEMLKVWIPFPLETTRQRNVKLISSSSTPTLSNGSPHNTIFMEKVAKKNVATHFEAIYSYEVAAQFFEPDTILSKLRPYNKNSQEYKKYTASQYPHIIINDDIKSLTLSIVENETNPLKQSSLIFKWIGNKFPWAGARDYSTIPNIPNYVLEQGHGDCGQVTLLYITLMRSIGIPARWESGWMLHPGEKNYHDWAETYFEGIGWVPTDVSFGRTRNEELKAYYNTGTDIYRMATNSNVNSPFSPAKQYIRTETVDCQAGEVEWRSGNIDFSKWNSELEIIKFEKIK
ncbi:MAG: transglutaminase-like domain-containing protein [Muribaculaceae bacterium]